MTIRSTIGLLSVVILAAASFGETPLGTEFTYQGQLKNSGASANGLHDLRFQLFDAVTGGAQVGTTQCVDNVLVTEGLFTARLDFGAAAFNGNERWMEISVRADTTVGNCASGAYTTLSPRQNLTPAPYASQTRGLFVNSNGRIGIGTTSPTRQLSLESGGLGVFDAVGQGISFTSDSISFSNASNEDPTYHYSYLPEKHEFFIGGGPAMTLSASGLASNSFTGSGAGLTGVNADLLDGLNSTAFLQAVPVPLLLTGSTSLQLVRGENTSIAMGAAGVAGWVTGGGSNLNQGVYGRSNSTQGRGVFGWSDAPSGVTSGVYGLNDSPSGIAVFGRTTSATGINYGGWFQSASSIGYGVRGDATSTTGFNYGVSGSSSSTSGKGVQGLATAASGATEGGHFESASTSGRAVYGVATAATGATYGVYGQSDSAGGYGVYGVATSTTSAITPTTHGVEGVAYSAYGSGVAGFNLGTNGGYGIGGRADGANGFGIVGIATYTSGITYGVAGQIDDGSTGFGGFFFGPIGSSGSKPFRIDHPDDPTNKYLMHYSTESPEIINFYSGKIILDASGEAVVQLPHYFAKINKDPRYTLTAVGAPMPMLHVAEEIDEASMSAGAKAEPGESAPLCSFRIGGGAPGGKVSWRLEAVRNDRWVQRHGAPVEVDKQGPERGTYQHPALYGQPSDKGVNLRMLQHSEPDATGHDSNTN